ncbi:beta strand repeat-containing protein [Methylobacter sp.]|uniref:beta strand repeat-containing protein n=1 Tax=Methylobacter sp. TaxID=2051955 RepID=UPI002FE0B354
MTTQTNTFSFNADNLNMWNSDKSSWLWKLGDPYSVSGSIDTTSFSADYTLSATATIGANLTATGGSVDYGCDMTVNASLPSVVRSGECFVIDTSQWTAHSQLNTVSPNLSAEFYAAFGANASLSNIQIGPMGVASTDFSYSLPTQKYNFLDISSSSPDTTTSYGPFTVSGRLPVVSASGTGTTSVTAQDQSDSPILSASADLDRLVAMLAAKQSLAPQAKAAGLAYLLGDTNGNKDMLENTLGSEDGIHLDYTLFDTELTAALYAMQKFTFDITSVGVTMVSSYNGETVTGQLGDAFIFSTPATGNGAININASYTLNGTLRNDTGIVGNCTLDLTALNFDLAGAGPFNTTIPGFTTSFGEDAYTDLYSLYDNTQTYNALANATGSYIVNYSTTATAAGAGTLTSRPSQEQIEFNGTSGNDYLYGNALNNTINGYSGSDVIFAGDGNDTITVVANWNEGSGDTINGGAGTDSLTVDASTYNDPFYHANAIYWNGVDATGKELTAVGAGSSLVQIQTLLSNAVKLGLRGVGAGVTFSDIENLNLIASAVTSHDNSVYNSNDLLIVRGTGSYNGSIGTDTLYADWSAATQAITWNNTANTTTQTVNGSSITGIERLLILSGSGNDNFSNTAVSTNDEFITGAGNDTINAGAGSDAVDAGNGNDSITVVANWNEGSGDTINGGAGTDSLTVDASTYNDPFYHANAIYWNGVDATGKELTAVGAGSSLVQIQTLLSNAVKLGLRGVGAGVTFSDIENLNLIASAVTSHDNSVYNSNDLLIVRGTGSYNGNIGTDTLYADWSAATQAITWNNAANTTTQTINGSSITGVERLLILSGSGNDNFSNTAVSTNDEFITGDGNDTINSGAGSDVINGGEGIDTSIYAAAAADYTIRHTTTAWTVQRNAEGQDTLSNVERLSFSDTRLALDLDGSAGAVAKILGAVFGRNSVSNTAYVGAGLNLLDNGMSNADLMQLVLKTKLGEGFSTTDEVALLYQNLFGQQPTTGTISQLSDLVNSGQFTQTSLAMLAANQDVNIANINLVGLAQTGLKYILV